MKGKRKIMNFLMKKIYIIISIIIILSSIWPFGRTFGEGPCTDTHNVHRVG